MTDSVKHVGLTGGIGSGKSTVARLLTDHGAVLVDADAISRELMVAGSPVLDEVAQEFGPDVLDESGSLDRAGLARIVFGDDSARERLNGIVHPAVRAESKRLVDESTSKSGFSGVIVQDIPLLVETGQGDKFDGVIVVEAPEHVRIERLVSTRGMSEDDARARIRSQATDDQRRAVATWTIDNSGSQEETAAQVDRLWGELTDG
ncbi:MULTISPECIES: dephospho-CoA kinase [Micrococcaceae]|uniref:dephospho-CoA kinase n=1 Tax=unclassified Kocuria TaxID=2649579 RepID=UPI001010BA42|nr:MULTISPECIES: dephospho-CoA kinase [unclassified Kocuria]